jgi:hypothetical protein
MLSSLNLARVRVLPTVGDCGGGSLVANTEDGETGDGAGVLGGLTLGIVEVGGDGDDGVDDLVSERSTNARPPATMDSPCRAAMRSLGHSNDTCAATRLGVSRQRI